MAIAAICAVLQHTERVGGAASVGECTVWGQNTQACMATGPDRDQSAVECREIARTVRFEHTGETPTHSIEAVASDSDEVPPIAIAAKVHDDRSPPFRVAAVAGVDRGLDERSGQHLRGRRCPLGVD